MNFYVPRFSCVFVFAFFGFNLALFAQLPADLPWSGSDCNGETVILQEGIGLVTCGVSTDIPANERFVVALFDFDGIVPATGQVDQTAQSDVYHHPTWTVDMLGNVYGTTINPTDGCMFVTASTNFSSAFGFGGTSQDAVLQFGSIGGGNATGSNDAAAGGSVYKLDGITGQATLFSSIPMQSSTLTHDDCESAGTEPRTNSSPALGNIAYDECNNQYFVTSFEDGRIYRLDANGNILDSYDPFGEDDGIPGVSDVEELVYGVTVSPDCSQLFFGGVDATTSITPGDEATAGNPGVFSIDLTATGGFTGTIDNSNNVDGTVNNFVGNETLHTTIPTGTGDSFTTDFVYSISDLEFKANGDLLVGVRTSCEGNIHTAYNHFGETNLIVNTDGDGLYDDGVTQLDISATGTSAAEDSYGGVACYTDSNGTEIIGTSSSDILNEVGPHGLAIFENPGAGFTAPIDGLAAVSYGLIDNNDPKGSGGDIDLYQGCLILCAVTAPVIAPDTQICFNEDAPETVTVTPAVGSTGVGDVLTYQWQSSTTSCTAGFTDVSGETNPTIDPGQLTQSTFYRVVVTNTVASTGEVCMATSNCIMYIVNPLPICTPGNSGPVCQGDPVTLTETGGDATAWSWSGPGGFTSSLQNPVVSPALPGDYTVVITDANGCESTCTTTVVVNDNPVPTILVEDPFCTNRPTPDPSFTITPPIGSAGFINFSFTSSPAGAVISGTGVIDVSATPPGTYTVTYSVTDATTGCIGMAEEELIILSPPVIEVVGVDETCNELDNGSATVTITSGTPTFTFLWSDGQTTQTASGLAAGVYMVTVTDGSDGACEAVESVTINQPPLLVCGLTPTDPISCGTPTGQLDVTTTVGGTPPYTYSIDGINFQASTTFTGLIAGAYEVTIMDANGCLSTCEANLSDPSPFMCGIPITTDVGECGQASDGSITTVIDGNITGLTFDYTLLPNNITNQTGIFTGLTTGSYDIVISQVGAGMDCEFICEAIILDSIGCVFDLALEKAISPSTPGFPGPYTIGSTITYDIEVFNQGNIEATDIVVTDYPPADGLVIASPTTWVLVGNNYENTIASIPAGSSEVIQIQYVIDPSAQTTSLINNAEITAAENVRDLVDEDDDIDNVTGFNDDMSELPTDGDTQDNPDNPNDIDDYDPALTEVVQSFDLALVKTLSPTTPGPAFAAGDPITFDIEVYNQGTLNAENIEISDYIPTGLILNDAAWSNNGSTAPTVSTQVIPDLEAGDSTVISITFTIDPAFMGDQIINNAEITDAENELGFADEDSDLATIDGATDDDSELATDDEYSDDYVNAPGTMDDPADVDDYDPVLIEVIQEFDLALTKVINTVASPGPYGPGQNVTFTITVFNQGTVDATDVEVSDYIPADMNFIQADNSDFTGAAPTVMALIPLVAAGTSETVDITLQIDPNFMGDMIVNDAEITAADNDIGAPDEDSTPGDNSTSPSEIATDDNIDDEAPGTPGTMDDPTDDDDFDPAIVMIGQSFDLALEKVINTVTSPPPYEPGDNVTFTINVFNQGTLDATNVVVTDYIPSGFIFDQADNIDFVGSAPNVSATIPSITAGATESVEITLQIDPATTDNLINDAEITSATNELGIPDEDSTPGDNQNTPSETGTDNDTDDEAPGTPGTMDNPNDNDDYDPAEVMVSIFDLALTKVIDTRFSEAPYAPGDTVFYIIEVSNQGNIDATNVVVTDYIPTGMIWAQNINNDFSGAAPNVTATIPSIAPAATVPLEIALIIDPNFMGTDIVNNAEITDATNALGIEDEDDPIGNIDGMTDDTSELGTDNDINDNPDNPADIDDYDPEQIMIDQVFDVALDKIFAGSTDVNMDGVLSPGDEVTFDITVYNQGSIDADDIVVTDYIPTGLLFSAVNNPVWTGGTAAAPSTMIAIVPAGDDVTVSITLTVDPSFEGTSIVNNAEITEASNDLGLIDEDDNILNVDGSADDTSELDTNDNIDDDGPGTPGTMDDPADIDDYDPEEIMIVQEFDLALSKTFDSFIDNDGDMGISAGDDVVFNINVFNQGTLEATNVVVSDYVPTGMNFIAADNPAWTGGTAAIPTTTIASIAPGGSSTVQIVLEIDPAFQGTSVVNNAEITDATNALGLVDEDDDIAAVDGSADDTSEQATDNDTDDEAPGTPGTMDNQADVDDYDLEEVMIGQLFDLALIKVVDSTTDNDGSGSITVGDDVTYEIEVINQGSLDAFNVSVVDYIPAGLILNDPNWTESPTGLATINNAIPDITVAEGSEIVTITFTIDPTFMGDAIENIAEISEADDDMDPTNGFPMDADSTPDDTNDDTIGANDEVNNTNGDEDDHDPEEIEVEQEFDVALDKVFDDFIDNDGDGILSAGDDVLYDITVYNQGTIDATDVEVTDYVPVDMSFNITDNPIWNGGTVLAPSTVIPIVAAGGSETVTIILNIDPTFMGTSIVNNAEITDASNSLGLIDEDDDIASIDGSSDDTSELATNDNIDDESPSAPGTMDNPNDIDDYDPEEIVLEQFFDLALTKTFDTFIDNDGDLGISAGDDIIYNINVFNQGTIDATAIEITDYLPTGMNFFAATNPIWTGGTATAPTTLIPTLSAGGSTTVSITLQIDPLFQGTEIVNNAEITDAMNALGLTDQDDDLANIDGAADDTSELDTDNDVNDEAPNTPGAADNPADIDDYDPELVMIGQQFDVALTKILDTFIDNDGDGLISAGDDVVFEIEVFNQGTLDAFNVSVVDYIPTGLTLNDPAWTEAPAGLATINTPIPDVTILEGSETVSITFTIDPTFMGTSITNVAEISSADDDMDATNGIPMDVDSDPDMTNDDTIGADNVINNENGDEDDHDPETIVIAQEFDLALDKIFNGVFNDNDGNGALSPGDDVIYDITVYNQGTVEATDIVVTDYIPTGMLFAPGDNPLWTGGTPTQPSTSIATLAPGGDVTVSISLHINPGFQGSTLTNNAEITDATNEEGLIDEDDDIADIDGSADDESELVTDNNVNDEAPGTPGTSDNTSDVDDYDPEQIGVVQEFDLALSKTVDSFEDLDGDMLVSAGDKVVFNINVFNQGTLDATNVVITDYVPTGMIFNAADNGLWTGGTMTAPTTTIASLLAGATSTVQITLEIDPTFQGSTIYNNAEITNGENALGFPDEDDPLDNIDGFADDTSEEDTDNDVNDEAPGTPGTTDNPADIDDYDGAEVTIGQVFDLALIKVLDTTIDNDGNGVISPGDGVIFEIEVVNQGTLDAFNVTVVDYIPEGLILNDASWTESPAGLATLNTPIPDITVAEQTEIVTIEFTIDPDFMGDTIENFAEISEADDDQNPNNAGPTDQDSTPDDTNDDTVGGNDVTDNTNGDEDDHDPEEISVVQEFDLALDKLYNGVFADTDGSGDLSAGDNVTFDISVYNQGTIDATNIAVTDYVPTGMTFVSALNPLWTGGTVSEPVTIIPGLAAGSSTSVSIVLTIDQGFMGSSIVNTAEITGADNPLGIADEDDPIDNITGDADDLSELASDNDINQYWSGI